MIAGGVAYLEGRPLCCGVVSQYVPKLRSYYCDECKKYHEDLVIYQTDECNVCFLDASIYEENGEPTYMVVFHDDSTFSSFTHGVQFSDRKPCKGLAPYERYLEKGDFSFDPVKMRTQPQCT